MSLGEYIRFDLQASILDLDHFDVEKGAKGQRVLIIWIAFALISAFHNTVV